MMVDKFLKGIKRVNPLNGNVRRVRSGRSRALPFAASTFY